MNPYLEKLRSALSDWNDPPGVGGAVWLLPGAVPLGQLRL